MNQLHGRTSGMKDLFGDEPFQLKSLPVRPVAPAPLAAVLPPGVPDEICHLFEHLAISMKNQGFARYSADALLHRIRWHMHVERGLRDFKANNNWTAPLARWLIAKHPVLLKGFFELRKSPHQED